MREPTKRSRAGRLEEGAMMLSPHLALFTLDGDVVAFSQAAQTVVGLNPMAAFIVEKLRDGMVIRDLAETLAAQFGIAADAASNWIVSTLDSLGTHGLLQGQDSPASLSAQASATDRAVARRRAAMPPYEAFDVVAEARYRLLGTLALVRFGHKAQVRMVDAVIGHLRTDDTSSPDTVIEIAGSRWGDRQLSSNIYCDRKPEAQAMQLSKLGPLVKSLVWTTAVNAYDFLLDLHAGVVARDGRCILLPAEAGSGKSSLTAALTHRGFDYYSDEVALIDRRTFCVPPVPLAVCVKSTGWGIMSRYYPQIADLPTHRRDDGKVVRYVLPPSNAQQQRPAPVSHIFFPLYSQQGPSKLEPLARSEAFARLMTQCLALRQRLDQDNVGRLIDWIAGIDCYALTFSSLEEAVALVESAIARK